MIRLTPPDESNFSGHTYCGAYAVGNLGRIAPHFAGFCDISDVCDDANVSLTRSLIRRDLSS